MLNTAKTVKGYGLNSLDGEIGTVKEFYFDDQYWAVRYLVAETGRWLPGRQVLISPHALGVIDGEKHDIAVKLTKKQIELSPDLSVDKPVSRQFEDDYYGYYGWPTYWSGNYMWGPYPGLVRDSDRERGLPRPQEMGNPHLRSTHEVTGYHISASDGEIGHVSDFIIDDETWAIRYLIVDTLNWWPGKKILLAPQWIERVSWGESKVVVDLTREMIKRSPEYDESAALTRPYESKLHEHYGRRGYWDEIPAAAYENNPIV
jgi:hypothetical protein